MTFSEFRFRVRFAIGVWLLGHRYPLALPLVGRPLTHLAFWLARDPEGL